MYGVFSILLILENFVRNVEHQVPILPIELLKFYSVSRIFYYLQIHLHLSHPNVGILVEIS